MKGMGKYLSILMKGCVFCERENLVVDDEKNIVDILKFNLAKEGFSTLEANDGEQAIELALSEKPDLILLDIMLPNGRLYRLPQIEGKYIHSHYNDYCKGRGS